MRHLPRTDLDKTVLLKDSTMLSFDVGSIANNRLLLKILRHFGLDRFVNCCEGTPRLTKLTQRILDARAYADKLARQAAQASESGDPIADYLQGEAASAVRATTFATAARAQFLRRRAVVGAGATCGVALVVLLISRYLYQLYRVRRKQLAQMAKRAEKGRRDKARKDAIRAVQRERARQARENNLQTGLQGRFLQSETRDDNMSSVHSLYGRTSREGSMRLSARHSSSFLAETIQLRSIAAPVGLLGVAFSLFRFRSFTSSAHQDPLFGT
eukprot:gnl/TRDRNA2_/TRDRNA2_74730_c1_seq1.p1 gnl/TRDRNA2_/TRDRNA2_74730_c1~~gnl/TRDRNA2_/TRDRNA2_74730_c1_seq1.p1  ORF type:complete len:271 (+),score=21.21 gnl/TRDRNA2_/TRDRNA2_74730_c1_seq1:122-934(+)